MFTLPTDRQYKIDKIASLLVSLRQSVGSLMFQSLIFKEEGSPRWVDVLDGGDRSCAKYVSSLLIGIDLVQKVRSSVSSLEQDLLRSRWEPASDPAACRVVVWGQKEGNDGFNYDHVGICLNRKWAYCNNPVTKVPELMRTFELKLHNGDYRPVRGFYQHPELIF